MFGIPPIWKPVRIGGCSFFRVAGEKIAEQWERWDKLHLMRQLDGDPTPRE